MKFHATPFQTKRPVQSNSYIPLDEFTQICLRYSKIIPTELMQTKHVQTYFNLLTNHFKTHERRVYFTLKMLTKYIGGKDVISSTRNSISHGRMPGDLKKGTSEFDKNTRLYFITKMRANRLGVNNSNGIYDLDNAIFAMYPIFANVMNCGEFSEATNLLSLYFLSLLNYYENHVLNENNNLQYFATLCYLDGGDHGFNLIYVYNHKNSFVTKLYVDSFYRAVRSQKEFDTYLSRCKNAYKAKEKMNKILSFFNKKYKNALTHEFVKSESKLQEGEIFHSIDEFGFEIIRAYLECTNFSVTLTNLHNEYYRYFHHEKELPKDSIQRI